MRYRRPSNNEAIDILDDIEFKIAGTEAACVARGRRKAWEAHRSHLGVYARLRSLALAGIGASQLFTEYKSTPAMGHMLADIGGQERVRFKSRIERSLVDGEVIGVRVTVVGFDE